MDALPLYITRPPAEYAADQKERILALGCSEEYAEGARVSIEAQAVQVASSYQGNLRASGKTTE